MQFIRAAIAFAICVLAASSCLSQAPEPTISFNPYGETMGGAPSLGSLGNTLYIAYIANDPSNTLWIETSTDGSTLAGPVHFGGITLGSDPAVAGDKANFVVQVAFRSATDDTLWVCSFQPPIVPSSAVICTNHPDIHMVGSPSIVNLPSQEQNYSHLFIAYKTSGNDPAGPNQIGIVKLQNNNQSTAEEAKLVIPVQLTTSPAITGFLNPAGGNFQSLTLFYQDPSSHKLVLQSVDSSLTYYGTPTSTNYSALIGGTPSACLAGSYTDYVVAFQANDPNNHLYYNRFEGNYPSGNNNTQSYGDYGAVYDNAQIGGTPAITCWSPNQQNMYSVAFRANDPGNHLWLGSQSF